MVESHHDNIILVAVAGMQFPDEERRPSLHIMRTSNA